MDLHKAQKHEIKSIKRLYNSAFPAEERAPFFVIHRRAKQNKAQLLSGTDGGGFVGFAYVVTLRDLVYVFYLAVDENVRGHGYGGAIMEEIKRLYKGKRIFLAREQLDKGAPNYDERVRRREFYMRCGFEDMGCMLKEASVVYDVMGIGGKVRADEYDELMKSWGGWLLCKIVDMRIIENE